MKRRLHSVAACLFLLSPPDIIPDGHRGVKVQTILDLGPLADSTCLQYEIEKGDTLEAIARTRLGSAERVGDIVARNPTLTPERLQVGQKLWLPPKQAAVKAPSYLFLEVPFSGPIAPISAPVRRQVEPLTMPGEVPFSRYGSYVLHVVPEQHLLAFTAAIRERRKPGEPILAGAAGESITKVMGRGVGQYVPVGSPVAKIVCTLTIEAGEDGKLRMRTDSANFDADDEPLEGGSGGSGAGGHGRQLLLLLLALAGSGWLLVRARRSPAAAPRAATANAS